MTVVWLGRDDNKPAGLTGSSGALKVWIDLMSMIRPSPFKPVVPENVDWYWINREGVPTDKGCAGARPFPFLSGYRPEGYEKCVEK